MLMPGAFIDGMALGALGLEDLLSSLVIARRCFAEGRHFRPSLSFRLSSAEALIRVCEEAPVRSATEQLLRARPPPRGDMQLVIIYESCIAKVPVVSQKAILLFLSFFPLKY